MPYTAAETGMLGVMHHADIPRQDASERRIVNSTMLALVEPGTAGPIDELAQVNFIATEAVSERKY